MSSTVAASGLGGRRYAQTLPALAALVAFFAAGCGPSKREAGLAVLLAAPLILGLGVFVLTLMSFLWKPLSNELAPPWKQVGALVGAVVVASGLCFALTLNREGFHGGVDLVPVATWWVGASFASISLVAWRALVQFAPRRAFVGALAFSSVLMFPLALQQVFATPGELGSAALVWIWPGYLGAVTGGVLAILVIEALVRRSRAKRAAPAG